MDPKIKEAWINALRSGKYKQTTGSLQNEDGFCCLGVLCDLYSQQSGEWIKNKEKITFSDGEMEREDIPPTKVAEWAGLEESDPFIMVNGEAKAITYLNDEAHLSFDELSLLIKEQL